MRILHYTLGLSPYRSGGLTKYSSDLIKAQSTKPQYHVDLLYPGDIFLLNPKRHIIKNKPYGKVNVYEIKNPSIVPLLYGIRFPASITRDKNTLTLEKLERFYARTLPDIFHVHTLMGLPYELLVFFKKKGVKIVFSTHDYFGLCSKVNFIDDTEQVCSAPSPYKCARCNFNAPNNMFLRIRNFKWLALLKKHIPYRQLSERKKTVPPPAEKLNFKTEEYADMFDYYKNIYTLIDIFHFNSSVSQNIYTSYISGIRHSTVIPLSHATIIDRRSAKNFNRSLIQFGFIGNLSAYKGFPLIKSVLIALQEEGFDNWMLNVWGDQTGVDANCSRILYCGKYTQKQLPDVFSGMDLLIVPSLCYETFGLVVLEALSHGVPVMVSSTVGAKDIVSEYDTKFIFDTPHSLSHKLKQILNDTRILKNYNQAILNKKQDFSFDEHINKINALYLSL